MRRGYLEAREGELIDSHDLMTGTILSATRAQTHPGQSFHSRNGGECLSRSWFMSEDRRPGGYLGVA